MTCRMISLQNHHLRIDVERGTVWLVVGTVDVLSAAESSNKRLIQ